MSLVVPGTGRDLHRGRRLGRGARPCLAATADSAVQNPVQMEPSGMRPAIEWLLLPGTGGKDLFVLAASQLDIPSWRAAA